MKGILRSVLDYGDVAQSELVTNLQRLIPARIEWTQPADKRLYSFSVRYFQQRLEVPSRVTISDFFEAQKDQEVLERIKDLDSVKPYIRTNFLHLLHVTAEEQNKFRALALLKESSEIIAKGLIIDKEKKQGLREGVLHFTQNAHKLLLQEHNSRTQGDILKDGQEVWDAYQEAKANKGLAWGKFCGLNSIDKVVKGIKKGELWLHAAYSGELKCLAGDTTVFDHRTQRRRRLKEMFDCGDVPIVTAIEYEGSSNRLVVTPASHLVQNGEREVFDLTLSSGRTIGATDNHRFLTPEGWVELKDLGEGDFVATPKQLRAEGKDTYTEHEVKLVGYLIGDGRIEDCISFTQEDEAIRNDFIACLREMGFLEGDADYENPFFSVKFPKDRTPYVRVGHGLGDRWHRVTSPVRVLLERLGLYGTDSYDKRIPSEFFGLSEDLIATLLGALWSTDGSCSTGDYIRSDREGKKGGPQSSYIISYASVSHGLCLDIQSLLLRLGIQSTVTFVDTEVNDEPYRFWVTRIVTNPGKALFCSKVKVVGKEDAFSYLASRIPDRDTTMLPSSLLPDGKRIQHNGYWRYTSNHKRNDTVTAEMAAKFDVDTGDIYWDRVKKVVPRGVEMTYDLSVPGHHTFVANDIVTHNTTYALNWAYNLVTWYRTNVFYVTLEMPYEQIRAQIYVMHSSNARFAKIAVPLDYEKVKSGALSPDEETFYQIVIKDFNNNEEYGTFEVWSPDVDVTIEDIRIQAEISHNEHEIGLLVVDHGGLVEPRRNKKSKDYTIELNSVLRDAKKMALHFNHGEKIPVLLLFQINREGKDYADKNEGRYKLRALSYSNEAERSADLVSTTYLNEDHRREGTTIFDCLKRRDGPLFPVFTAKIDWLTRRMANLEGLQGASDKGIALDDFLGLHDTILEIFE